MSLVEITETNIRIGEADRFVEFGPRSDAGLGHTNLLLGVQQHVLGNLNCSGGTCFPSLQDFADVLAEFHSTLAEPVSFSDVASTTVTFTPTMTGHVNVEVNVFSLKSLLGIDGQVRFDIRIDQSYLPEIVRALRRLYPAGTETAGVK